MYDWLFVIGAEEKKLDAAKKQIVESGLVKKLVKASFFEVDMVFEERDIDYMVVDETALGYAAVCQLAKQNPITHVVLVADVLLEVLEGVVEYRIPFDYSRNDVNGLVEKIKAEKILEH
jgi:hypothetical protein